MSDMSKTITYEEFREYLKQFNPVNYSPAKWYSLTREESEKAKKHLLVIKAATTITAQDISMESAITSAIEHFLRHKNKRISRQALELAKAVEPIKDIVAEHWEGN